MKSILRALAVLLSPLVLTAQTLPGGFHAAYIEGNVVGSDTGKPLTGAKVDVIGAKIKKNGMTAYAGCGAGFALSANNGNFAVGVGQSNMCVTNEHPFNGNYYVSVSKRGYLPSVQHVDFGTASTNAIGGLVFRLTPAHATIVGHVLSGGKGVPYAFAWVMPDVWAMVGHTPKGHVKGSLVSESPMIRTDQYGNFQISVSPGSYVVMAGKTGYQLVTKTVNPEQQHIFQKMQMMLNKLPAQYRHSGSSLQTLGGPQPGAYVTVATGQTVAANLVLAKAPSPVMSAHPDSAVKPSSFTPHEMTLVGQARLGPNNVLFFTWRHPQRGHEAAGAAIIVRSRSLLGGGKIDPLKDHVKVLYPGGLYGLATLSGCQQPHQSGGNGGCVPGAEIYSFTDPSAKPGVSYYYYIFEMRSFVGIRTLDLSNIGLPHSNALPLLAH